MIRCPRTLVFVVFAVAASFAAISAPLGRARTNNASPQTYWAEEVVKGLKYPSAMDWLPNGDILIVEREGGLRIVQNGKLNPKTVEGVPPSFQNVYNGLKDVLVDPEFENNKTIYLLISEGTYEAHYAAVYRARYEFLQLDNVRRIFRSKDEIGGTGQISARMQFLPDKTLLVGVPEDNFHKSLAQRLDSHVGKMIRIDREGGVPKDNPFANNPNALPEIWSYGHRVQTGIYFDTQTQELWEVEPGPRGGDELNVLKAGGNFGWSTWTWGFEYGGGLAGPLQEGSGIESPVHVWMPLPRSKTPAGLTRYRGSIYPAWKGDFFIGHLAGKALERLRLDDRHDLIQQEKMLLDLGERIREVKEGPDQYIYVLTDNDNGRLLRLQPGTPSVGQMNRVARGSQKEWLRRAGEYDNIQPGDPVKGKRVFMERCAGCHRVSGVVSGGDIGPDLAGVYGRAAGSVPGYSYSPAMLGSPQRWNEVSLDLFLADPGRYLPGTFMAAPPLNDQEMRRQIVGFLKHPPAD